MESLTFELNNDDVQNIAPMSLDEKEPVMATKLDLWEKPANSCACFSLCDLG